MFHYKRVLCILILFSTPCKRVVSRGVRSGVRPTPEVGPVDSSLLILDVRPGPFLPTLNVVAELMVALLSVS